MRIATAAHCVSGQAYNNTLNNQPLVTAVALNCLMHSNARYFSKVHLPCGLCVGLGDWLLAGVHFLCLGLKYGIGLEPVPTASYQFPTISSVSVFTHVVKYCTRTQQSTFLSRKVFVQPMFIVEFIFSENAI